MLTGHQIRQAREHLGLTVEALGDSAGVDARLLALAELSSTIGVLNEFQTASVCEALNTALNAKVRQHRHHVSQP